MLQVPMITVVIVEVSWSMLAVYLMATVTAGATPLSAAAAAVGASADPDYGLGRWAPLDFAADNPRGDS